MKLKVKLALTVMTLSFVYLVHALTQLNQVQSPFQSSVTITNYNRTSGGSGVVYRSYPSESHVLTNKHVCNLVEKGGLVSTAQGTYRATGVFKDTEHDLCLIKVNGDLGVNTKIGDAPDSQKYTTQATIVGHPHLFPTIQTSGHVSGTILVQIMTGMRECTAKDQENPDSSFFCALLGKMPVIKLYEATLVSATIMPGSSGSGVFDSANNLIGVVFAGSGELGYALTVPYAYIVQFLSKTPLF